MFRERDPANVTVSKYIRLCPFLVIALSCLSCVRCNSLRGVMTYVIGTYATEPTLTYTIAIEPRARHNCISAEINADILDYCCISTSRHNCISV